jgi:hypothetical protein
MSQEHYWKEFYRLKAHVGFLELLLGETEKIDRHIKIFLAVTSSASIGGWVVWKEQALLWSILIAGSQVLNAIRQYLPYKERLKALSGLLNEFDELLVGVESKWLDIAAGELTEAEIRKALFDFRTRKMKAIKKHFPDNTIPENEELFKKAENKAMLYFNNFYSEEQ